jgi:nitroreductase
MEPAFRRDLQRDGLLPGEIDRQLQRSRQRILGSPAPILLCMDVTVMDAYPDENRQRVERQMAVQSVALAGGTLLLAAHAEGLGGVWLCAPAFVPELVQQALWLPETWEPQALLLVGYPDQMPSERDRLPLEEVARFW